MQPSSCSWERSGRPGRRRPSTLRVSGQTRDGERREASVSASQGIGRRSFLTGCGGAVLGLTWSVGRSGPARAHAASPEGPKKVTIVEFSDAGARKGTVTVDRITKSEEEWRKQLSPESFEVTRHEGTERPYTNEHPNGGAKGVFRCICCATALLDCRTKLESGP